MLLLFTAAIVFSICLPASGETLIVNGQRIEVVLQGRSNPPIVFESGMGEDAATWSAVQPEVAKFASTLAFDRPGLGRSAATQAPRDGLTLATELRDLLHTAHLPPPYVLVGHSLGGAVIQIFAHEYPQEVAGLVLVDPEDGRIVQRLKAKLSEKQWSERQAALNRYGPMPIPVQREYEATVAQTGSQTQQIRSLPKVPIILLTGTAIDPTFPGNPEEQHIKWDLHRELVSANPEIKQIEVPESRHYIQNDAPQKVIDAIRDVWNRSPHSR